MNVKPYLLVTAFAALSAACSKASEPVVGDASLVEVVDAEAGPVEEAGVVADGGDGGVDAGACTCSPNGACDEFGCPPAYQGSTFAAWCQAVQTGARGHEITMKTCGSLLLMTYAVDGGCDRGYAVEQPSGALIATLDECGGGALTCALLTPHACLPACCLDKTCTLGISSLCPAWEPDAGD